MVVSHASYYLCKLVGKFPRGESVQFCNARWSSPSWSCHTASFPWIETVALPAGSQNPHFVTFPNLEALWINTLALLLVHNTITKLIHSFELGSEAQRWRDHRSHEHFPSRSHHEATPLTFLVLFPIVSAELFLAPVIGRTLVSHRCTSCVLTLLRLHSFQTEPRSQVFSYSRPWRQSHPKSLPDHTS